MVLYHGPLVGNTGKPTYETGPILQIPLRTLRAHTRGTEETSLTTPSKPRMVSSMAEYVPYRPYILLRTLCMNGTLHGNPGAHDFWYHTAYTTYHIITVYRVCHLLDALYLALSGQGHGLSLLRPRARRPPPPRRPKPRQLSRDQRVSDEIGRPKEHISITILKLIG